MKDAANPSPAALRIAIDAQPAQLRVLKCRGGNPPTRPIPFPTTTTSAATAFPARSPMTIGQEPAGEGIAQKPAMDGRRPASGQEALMKGRSNTPTGRLLRDQATRTSTNRQLHAQATRTPTDHPLHDQTTRIPTNHLLRAPTTPSAGNFLHDQPVRAPTTMLPAPATIPFRPRLLPTQAQ